MPICSHKKNDWSWINFIKKTLRNIVKKLKSLVCWIYKEFSSAILKELCQPCICHKHDKNFLHLDCFCWLWFNRALITISPISSSYFKNRLSKHNFCNSIHEMWLNLWTQVCRDRRDWAYCSPMTISSWGATMVGAKGKILRFYVCR